MAQESPFWEGVHKPDGFTPLEEMASDQSSLSPEKILVLRERLKEPGLSDVEREDILKLLGEDGEEEEQREAA